MVFFVAHGGEPIQMSARGVGYLSGYLLEMAMLRLRMSSAAFRNDQKIVCEATLRFRYCSGLVLVLATTMDECRASRSAFFGVRPNRKRVIYWLSLGGAMLILPTFCPDCSEPTMEVVEHSRPIHTKPNVQLVAAKPLARFRLSF